MNQTSSSSLASGPGPANPQPRRPAQVAVICSSWHGEIVQKCRDALLAELARNALPRKQVEVFQVPGAFEIPLLAKRLAITGKYDALIACGFVVNGGIYRHEFVAGAVIDGLMRAQLDCDIPVLSAVLTPRDFHEHEDHERFFAEHMVKKGTEVARACLQMLSALNALNDVATLSDGAD